MMSFETSCMPSFKWPHCMERTMVCHLYEEFHYESIYTWPKRTKSSLPMWWLLTRCGRWLLQVSLLDQQVQLWHLAPLLKSTSIEGFIKDTILFRWPWRCMAHSGVICIVSSRSVFIFSMIDDQEVIYSYLFAFNFSNNVLVLPFNVLYLYYRKKDCVGRWCMF